MISSPMPKKRMPRAAGAVKGSDLKTSPFFRGFKRAHLDILAGHAKWVRFREDQVAFKAEEKAAGFYLIKTGSMAVELPVCGGRTFAVQELLAGDVLGWSWLIPPYRWHLGGRATEPVEAIFFDGRAVRQELFRDAGLGFEIYRRFAVIMSRRLEGTFLKLYAD